MVKKICLFVLAVWIPICTPMVCSALSPDEVLVVANMNSSRSASLAGYYMVQRQIPKENIVYLWVTEKEACSRKEYDEKIAPVIRRYLKEKQPANKIRCLVTVYGVPLKINASKPSQKQKEELSLYVNERDYLKKSLENDSTENAAEKASAKKRIDQLNGIIKQLRFRQNTGASVDSELTLLLKENYDIASWTPNPYFVGLSGKKTGIEKKDVLMVARLDGPTPEIVKRIIDDSIATEKDGLTGNAYIDARWPDPGNKSVSGYTLYDKSLHLAAKAIQDSHRMPVTLESTSELFALGQCESAALYCGWYKLENYIDAFQWKPGSIGYHIASYECRTLRNPENQGWCKRMLEEGVAATIGPVEEPYVESFTIPEVFFKSLTDGYLTLAECYIISTPFLSWKQVLIGDPLYRPFKIDTK